MSKETKETKEKERVITMKLPEETLNRLKEVYPELEYTVSGKDKTSGYAIIDEIHEKVFSTVDEKGEKLIVPRINKKMTSKTIAKKKMTDEEFKKIKKEEKKVLEEFYAKKLAEDEKKED